MIVGHAAFCVVVFQNVVARLRRTAGSYDMTRPLQAPVVNVVAAVMVLLSIIPIYVAQRLSSDTATGSRV